MSIAPASLNRTHCQALVSLPPSPHPPHVRIPRPPTRLTFTTPAPHRTNVSHPRNTHCLSPSITAGRPFPLGTARSAPNHRPFRTACPRIVQMFCGRNAATRPCPSSSCVRAQAKYIGCLDSTRNERCGSDLDLSSPHPPPIFTHPPLTLDQCRMLQPPDRNVLSPGLVLLLGALWMDCRCGATVRHAANHA